MKESINNIASFLDSDILDNAKIAKENIGDYEHLETSISDSYGRLKLYMDQLKNAIDKGYLERVSLNRRTNIISHLTNIKKALDVLKQYEYQANYQSRQYQNQYIQSVYDLKDSIDDAKIFEMSKSYGSYYYALEKLSKTEEIYNDLLANIIESEKIHIRIRNDFDTLRKDIITANEINNNASTIYEEISTKNERITKLLQETKEYAQDIEDRRSKIESFHKNIDEMSLAVDDLVDSNSKNIYTTKAALSSLSQTTEERLKELHDKAATTTDDFIKKAEDIIDNNIKLQVDISTLLHGATAGKLYTEFRTESDKIRKELWFWLAGVIIINIVLLSFSSTIIFGSKYFGIPALNLKTIQPIIFSKVFLTVPIILLDWFLIKQYNIRRTLMEKYTFKSLVSISLIHYNELVKEHIENGEASSFIINSIDKIYSSPFEISEHKTNAVINNLTDKSTTIIEKAVEKALDKVKS